MIAALPRVALQLWIVLFIVFFGAEVVHLEPTLRVTTQLVYGLPVAAWAAWRLRGPIDRLDWGVLALLAVYLLVSLLSRDRTESLGTLGLVTAYAAWFLLMRRETSLQRPIVLAAATGFALTLGFNAYLGVQEKAQQLTQLGAVSLEGVVTFPWETVNALPVLVLLAIPLVAWLEPGAVRRILGVVVAVSAAVVIPISNGRAGYLGLAVAALTLAALTPSLQRRVRQLGRRTRVAGAVGAVVVAVAIVAVVGPRFFDALRTSGRLLLWEQGTAMFTASPLFGSGPGVYAWVRGEFAPQAADLLAVRLPHEVPLLTLAEGGLVLLGSFAAVAWLWAVETYRGRGAWTLAQRVAVAALVGFAAASLLDDFSFLPALIATVLALAAWLAPIRSAAPTVGWLLPAALAMAAGLALPSVVGVDIARGSAQEGRTAMVAGDPSTAVAAFERAAGAHPENGGVWLGLGMAAAYAGDDARAVEAYERAVQASPGDPRGYAALAHLRPDDALGLLEAAADRTFDDPQDAVRLGLAYVQRDRVDDATYAWARAVALRSEILRLLPYEETGISMEQVAEEALVLIAREPRPGVSENDAARWDIGLVLGALPEDAGPAWRAVEAALDGKRERGLELARAAIDAAPTDARGFQALAAVHAFACDADAEVAALEREKHALGAWTEPDPEPRALREFVYREASLGPSQPPGARLDLRVERWPWSLVDRPECAS